MRVLLFLLAVAACDEWPYIDADQTMRPFQQDADRYLRKTLIKSYGMTPTILNIDARVSWSTTHCPDTAKTAVIYNGDCYAGITFACDLVYVADRGCIGDSAFAHEMGHCFRFVQQVGGDPSHWDESYWSAINGIDAELRELEGCDAFPGEQDEEENQTETKEKTHERYHNPRAGRDTASCYRQADVD